MTELTAMLLLRNRPRLGGTLLPFPDIGTVDLLADKCSLIRLASTLDIPSPATYYTTDTGLLPGRLDEFPCPIVLKPGKSWLEHNGKWLQSSVYIARDASEAYRILDAVPSFQAGPFLIQEMVPGSGYGVFALYDSGRPLAFFAHRRIREKPPRGGVSVLSESVMVDPALLKYARALLDKAGWHGVAMVEFRVADDGTPWLMEVNTRFWGSLQLSVDAGVDFPWMLYRMACGEQVEAVEEYKTGIRLRWLLGDLDNLYLTLRDEDFSLLRKIQAIIQFLLPLHIGTRHEVNRWKDLGPAWWELKHYIKDLLE
jgi:predicted ATP-grasp superfamily ATP-dependent carboligase